MHNKMVEKYPNKVQIRNPMVSVKKEKHLFEVWYGDTFP